MSVPEAQRYSSPTAPLQERSVNMLEGFHILLAKFVEIEVMIRKPGSIYD